MNEEVEHLREALASANQLAAAQQARLRELELVLSGIQGISAEDEPGAAITRTFDLLRSALEFDLALVLQPQENGYACVASTEPRLVGSAWPAEGFFQRIASGRPAVVPDIARIPEWTAFPGGLTSRPAAGILAPISTAGGAGLLILCSERRGIYSAADLALVSKLGLVVSQTLAAGQQRRLAEAIQTSELRRDAAVRANEAKSQFFANISHEIRTPLNGVVAVADMLARTELAPRQQEMVELILDSGRMLERLLNDVLDFAKVESGRLDLELRPMNLHQDLTSVFDLFAAKADEKGLALEVTGAEQADRWLEADSLRIRQVVSNLLSNAVKFTVKGGVQVSLSVEAGAKAQTVRISVRDTGCGFSAETAERLFDRFEQEDKSITRKFGGSGLGLSIARSLARLMGGDVTCRAQVGEGAVFDFWFTAQAAARPTADAEGEAPVSDLEAIRVLVVEDNPNNRRIAGMILEMAGATPYFAENGREACLAVEAQHFDLVLMDLQMPVMDGLTAIRAIRQRQADEGLPPIPIIAVSANAMTHQVEEAVSAGADAHVAKPIDPAALLAAIAELAAPADDRSGRELSVSGNQEGWAR
ncbi:ATP-binding protein [Phenylobacterium deserti]|uniref:histidine kinase n=1 Tax=Phenylobacterium deserti TaxID=1914756 RepID=A0A328AY48_9CAUL|nr:ATP-binding protein [Phenylobacterium deserti]RAK57758.1 hybrid sensor histidine kinase/response regulator [Phenylobacterium deserti]